jgi:hypothetical protein
MIATKGGHATGISDCFDVVGLLCTSNHNHIPFPLSIGSCSCLVWLDFENVTSGYWLAHMLGYMESDLRLVVGSIWGYGLPMQRYWQLLRSLHGEFFASGWLDLDKLSDRFHELVFGWYLEARGGKEGE